jgi:hypothetical protein
MSGRKLEVLIRHLPITSELVTAQNGGRRKWTQTEHLLADIWAVTVEVNSPKGSLPKTFDHPTRAAITAEAKDKRMAALKLKYQHRKRERARKQESKPLNAVREVTE